MILSQQDKKLTTYKNNNKLIIKKAEAEKESNYKEKKE